MKTSRIFCRPLRHNGRGAALAGAMAVAAVGLLLTTGGCGGGKSSGGASPPTSANQSGQNSGRVVLNVAWPDRSAGRAVPYAADAITVSVYEEDGTCLVGDSTTDHPCHDHIVTVLNNSSGKVTNSGQPATLSTVISDLPVRRPLTFSIKAYGTDFKTNVANRDVPVATGQRDKFVLQPGVSTALDVTLNSTAASLSSSAPVLVFEPTASAASSQTVNISAADALGGLVLLQYDADGTTPQILWDGFLPDGTAFPLPAGTVSGLSLARPSGASVSLSAPIMGTSLVVKREAQEAGVYTLTAHYYDDPANKRGEKAQTSISVRIGQPTRALMEPTPNDQSYGQQQGAVFNTTTYPLDTAVDSGVPQVLAVDLSKPDGMTFYGSVIANINDDTYIGGYNPDLPDNAVDGIVNQIAPALHLAFPPKPVGPPQSPAKSLDFFVLADAASIRSYEKVSNYSGSVLRDTKSSTALNGTVGGDIFDLAASHTQAAVYVLYRGNIEIRKLGANGNLDGGAFVVSFATVDTAFAGSRMDTDQSDNLYVADTTADKAKILKFDANGKPVTTFFVDSTRLGTGAPTADGVYPNGIYNPNRETLGTIIDLAAYGDYLYVLAKNENNEGRVHIFNSANGKWLYSINYVQQTRLDAAQAISASGNQVIIAYHDPASGDAKTLQYVNTTATRAVLPFIRQTRSVSRVKTHR